MTPIRQQWRGSRARRAVRWVLVGWVIAGILVMHVLSDHDAPGGHLMVTDASVSTQMSVSMATDQPGLSIAEIYAGAGDADAMDSCILFLVAGWVMLRLLSALFRLGPDLDGRSSLARVSRLTSRGPPGAAPPRIRLCVLRV